MKLRNAGDAVFGKDGGSAAHEARAGLTALIGVDLGIGQPGVIIDRAVHILAARAAATLGASLAPPYPPAAAARDASELPDVHVDQLARASRS